MRAAHRNKLPYLAGMTVLEAVWSQHKSRGWISGVGFTEVGHSPQGREQTKSRKTYKHELLQAQVILLLGSLFTSSRQYILSEQLYRLDMDFSRQSNAKPNTQTTEYQSEFSLGD